MSVKIQVQFSDVCQREDCSAATYGYKVSIDATKGMSSDEAVSHAKKIASSDYLSVECSVDQLKSWALGKSSPFEQTVFDPKVNDIVAAYGVVFPEHEMLKGIKAIREFKPK